MQIVNLPLIKNPLNWVIIVLMLLIAGFAGHYALELVGITPNTGDGS